MIYQSSPGLQNPDFIQPTAPAGHTEDVEPETKETSAHKREQNVQEGSSNFINIHLKHGSNIYTGDLNDTNDEEAIDYDSDGFDEDGYDEEDSEDEFDDDGRDSYDNADYVSYHEEEDYDQLDEFDSEDDGNEDQYSSHDERHIDPLSLEKEDHDLDQETAKFDESEIREKSEKLVAHNKKVLDNKFLKDLETPVKPQGFSSKQEEHSPYSYVGHKLSHMKPFRSFKEYLDKSQNHVKVTSTASKSKENNTESVFDEGDVTSQRVARNSPPTDPSRFNTEDDDPPDKRSIKKKVLHKTVGVVLEAKEKAKEVKNIII